MTIKETAGKMLLYFYQLQRTVPAAMPYRQLGFLDKADGGVSMTSDKKWLTKDLLDINSSAADIYNAFRFLLHKGFIHSVERATTGKRIYIGVQVTHTGIDIIEGIEQGHEGQREFGTAFNISADGNSDVDGFIKEQLSELLG